MFAKMKVVSLVDNVCGVTSCFSASVESEHGLSLYIELDCGARVLFDTGQGDLFARNAFSLGIDLASVDLAVISHGHYDHAGGLATFLKINSKAPVYIRESAFEDHYSVKDYGLKPIGFHLHESAASGSSDGGSDGGVSAAPVSAGLSESEISGGVLSGRLVFCREVERLPYGITLFSNPPADFPEPPGNALLLGPDAVTPDTFSHEQSMLITEPDRTVLFGGCAHRGIANILAKAETLAPGPISAVFSGMHIKSLFDSSGTCVPFAPSATDCSEPVSQSMPAPIPAATDALVSSSPGSFSGTRPISYIESLASVLCRHPNTHFYTMHCTGTEGFRRLSALMPGRISYFSCGDSVIL